MTPEIVKQLAQEWHDLLADADAAEYYSAREAKQLRDRAVKIAKQVTDCGFKHPSKVKVKK